MNWITIIMTAAITTLTCYGLHELDISYIKTQQQAALESQATQLNSQCLAQKQVTSEIDNASQKQNTLIAGKYDSAVQLLLTASMQPTATKPSSINHGTSFDNGLYYTDVRAALAVTHRQKIASDQASELQLCQQFILDERNPK